MMESMLTTRMTLFINFLVVFLEVFFALYRICADKLTVFHPVQVSPATFRGINQTRWNSKVDRMDTVLTNMSTKDIVISRYQPC